jgi:membrane associated rhomboid family serine protease
VKATSIFTRLRYPHMRCYRHPDRETGLSCSECGRPICTECMTVAPVGLRCPEHATQRPRAAAARVATAASRAGLQGHGYLVTKILIALNVGVYFVQLGMGAGLNADSGWIFDHGALIASKGLLGGHLVNGVAQGEWWRLISAAFLHHGPIHLGFNMLALWWFGAPVEMFLGRARFLLLYLASGLAGSAGALIASPNAVTVGASGAIFGILGAALVLERQRLYVLGGSALTIIVINIVFTLAVPGISIGGHIGGLIGGGLGTLALSHFGRTHPTYGRAGLPGIAGVVAVGALAVLVSYWKVSGIA